MVLKQTLQCVLSVPCGSFSPAGPVRVATAADPTPCSLPRAALQVHGHNCKADVWALSRLPTPCQQSQPLFISATVFPATLHFKPVQLLAGNCLPLCLAEENNNYNINNPKENRRQRKKQSPKPWSLAFLHAATVLQTALQKNGGSLCLPERCHSPLLVLVLLCLGRLPHLSHQPSSFYTH